MNIIKTKSPVSNPLYDQEQIHIDFKLLKYKKKKNYPTTVEDIRKNYRHPRTGKMISEQAVYDIGKSKEFDYLDKEIDKKIEQIKKIENEILNLARRRRGDLV